MSPLLSFAVTAALVCYALTMAVATLRMLRGPSAQDRVLALDFISLNGMLVVLVLGILHLLNFPLGTALGVYTIWALLYESQAQASTPSTPQSIT